MAAAGSAVRGADLLGYAPGTAKGMAPRARVSTYKVCWVSGCFSSDILKGMEVAVADGVDVLSLSLGGGTSDYYLDSIAIGAYSRDPSAPPESLATTGAQTSIRSAHPDWSPAVIRLALMTTAYVSYPSGGSILDVATGRPAAPLDIGAGHVDPSKAVDPGLVYDITAADYLDFHCAIDYEPSQIAALTKHSTDRCSSSRTYAVTALNYPSFSVTFPTAGGKEKHTRTITVKKRTSKKGSSACTAPGAGASARGPMDAAAPAWRRCCSSCLRATQMMVNERASRNGSPACTAPGDGNGDGGGGGMEEVTKRRRVLRSTRESPVWTGNANCYRTDETGITPK